ncbi:MAG: hypothetical protein OEZ57_07745 [Nitrospirota bacterium]|nr:hypothetical protein [Nitrospirota bacterium]
MPPAMGVGILSYERWPMMSQKKQVVNGGRGSLFYKRACPGFRSKSDNGRYGMKYFEIHMD